MPESKYKIKPEKILSLNFNMAFEINKNETENKAVNIIKETMKEVKVLLL